MITTKFTIDLTALRQDGKQIFEKPVEFECSPFMALEQQKIMQNHFALTDSEKQENEHSFSVGIIKAVIAAPPKNLPGFPENPDDLKDAIYSYLIEKTEINEILVPAISGRYLDSIGGRYFFRKL